MPYPFLKMAQAAGYCRTFVHNNRGGNDYKYQSIFLYSALFLLCFVSLRY
jgi:hypothetical protein